MFRLSLCLRSLSASLCQCILKQLESKVITKLIQSFIYLCKSCVCPLTSRPIVFGLSCENAFEADFVLATLVDDVAPSQSQQPSQAVNSTQTNQQKPQTSTPVSHGRLIPPPPSDSDAVLCDDVLSGRDIVSQDISDIVKPATQKYREVDSMNRKEETLSQERQSQVNSSLDVIGPSPEMAVKGSKNVLVHPSSVGHGDESDNDYEFIPKMPPEKKVLNVTLCLLASYPDLLPSSLVLCV